MSNSPSSTDHLTMQPLASRLQMISPSGNDDGIVSLEVVTKLSRRNQECV
jgi:hypothetical protein